MICQDGRAYPSGENVFPITARQHSQHTTAQHNVQHRHPSINDVCWHPAHHTDRSRASMAASSPDNSTKQESQMFHHATPPPPPHTLRLSGRPDCIPAHACCSIDSPHRTSQQQLQRPAMLHHTAAPPHGPAAPVGSRCGWRCTCDATAAKAGPAPGRRLLWLQPAQPAALLLTGGPHPQRFQ